MKKRKIQADIAIGVIVLFWTFAIIELIVIINLFGNKFQTH